MLQSLFIQNVALIDKAHINFTNGLNVLSGETGSGKSVIIDSLNFVLGAKADKMLIRSGESECFVKAEFLINNNFKVYEILDELDIERDDVVIISRKFNVDGKSVIKVNGNTVTVGMLKKLTSLLVDVHGQSEHFHLLKTSNQLELIDRFGGKEISAIKDKISNDFCSYKEVLKNIDLLGGDESQRLIKLDILNYQIDEIENCDLKENEEEELNLYKQKLEYQEKISLALNCLKNSINGEGGISDILGSVVRNFTPIANLDKEYAELSDRIDSVYSEIDDISDCASALIDGFDFSEYDADKIESRLETIKNLKKKYGTSYNEIINFLNDAKEEKNKLENFNEIAEGLLKDKSIIENKLFDNYLKLRNLRKQYAEKFTKNVLDELKELGMGKSKFEILFNGAEEIADCRFDSENGIDNVEFMFSANLGEPLKPLSAVISGGEISRFMLSIKAQTAKHADVSTFIFDEIDAGISGIIAKVVSFKFAKISKEVQVLAITHLPQISAMADNNLLIAKTEISNKTITTVKSLNNEDKVEEVIRLVGGNTSSDSARKHAEEMIEIAVEYKKSL